MPRLLMLLVLLGLIATDGYSETFRPPRARRVQRSGEQRDKIDLHEEMTPQQFRRSGLHKVSSQELRNLEVWLSKWCSDEIAAETTNILAIESIEGLGTYLNLSDGSTWKISPFDRRLTRRWSRDHRIEIQPSSRVSKYYKLKNLSTAQTVKAELTGGPNTVGEPRVYTIDKIGRGGETLTLEDGSVWKISPFERREARYWTVGHRIEIQGHVKRGNSGRLYNLSTRQEISAKLLRGPRAPRQAREQQIEGVEIDEQQDLHEDGGQGGDESLYRKEGSEKQ